MDLLTRRTFLASVAATLAAGSSPATEVISVSSPVTVSEVIPLYVHYDCGGLLSFGKQYDDFSDMPDWTWGRRIARDYMGDPEVQELDAAAIEYAKQEYSDWTGVDVAEVDEQEFARWLKEPLPHEAAYEALERWANNHGPVAQAAEIIETLGIAIPEKEDDWSKDAIRIQHFPYVGATVGDLGGPRGCEQSLQLLRKAIAARGLPIKIVETR